LQHFLPQQRALTKPKLLFNRRSLQQVTLQFLRALLKSMQSQSAAEEVAQAVQTQAAAAVVELLMDGFQSDQHRL
jgi:response regulator of citrate/malate metabolism